LGPAPDEPPGSSRTALADIGAAPGRTPRPLLRSGFPSGHGRQRRGPVQPPAARSCPTPRSRLLDQRESASQLGAQRPELVDERVGQRDPAVQPLRAGEEVAVAGRLDGFARIEWFHRPDRLAQLPDVVSRVHRRAESRRIDREEEVADVLISLDVAGLALSVVTHAQRRDAADPTASSNCTDAEGQPVENMQHVQGSPSWRSEGTTTHTNPDSTPPCISASTRFTPT